MKRGFVAVIKRFLYWFARGDGVDDKIRYLWERERFWERRGLEGIMGDRYFKLEYHIVCVWSLFTHGCFLSGTRGWKTRWL